MAIPRTTIHLQRVCDQVLTVILNVQRDMVSNATVHKTWAQAQLPLDKIQTAVRDCAVSYLTWLQRIIDRRAADPTRWTQILASRGLVDADIQDAAVPLRQAAIALRDAPRTTYAEIITACDAVLTAVDKPDSLWTE